MPQEICKVIAKFGKYNVGEMVSVDSETARRWCGDIDPRFKVTVRLPPDEAAKYLRQPPVHKMVTEPEMAKDGDEEQPRRGPGRPPGR